MIIYLGSKFVPFISFLSFLAYINWYRKIRMKMLFFHTCVPTFSIITHTHSRSLNSCNTSHTRISCGFYKSYLLHHMRATISCRFSFIVIAFIRFLTLVCINVFLKLCSINQIVRRCSCKLLLLYCIYFIHPWLQSQCCYYFCYV